MERWGMGSSSGRIAELDGLRGLAALAVLFYHLPRGFWFGATGVDLFFVLSGFLISGIVFRGRGRTRFLREFYWRRSLRIFPIYYLALMVAFGINSVRTTPGDTTGFPFYLFYLQHIHAYWGGVTPPANISLGHTWTLAIEEQFYLFWPAAILLVRKSLTPLLVATFFFLPFALRSLGLPRNVLLGHTDGLALGALLAWLMPYATSISQVKQMACHGAIAVVGFVSYGALWAFMSAEGYMSGNDFVSFSPAITIISIAYFGLIGFVVSGSGRPAFAFLRNRYLVYAGTISYGLYLYHWILYETFDTVLKFGMQVGDPIWLDVLKVATSFAVAGLSWRWIEQPILRLRGHSDERRVSLTLPEEAPASTHFRSRAA